MSEQFATSETERPSAIWLTAVCQWLTAGRLVVGMMGLQLVWLGIIWGTGAATAAYKLPLLVVYTFITGMSVAFMPAVYVHKWERVITHLANFPRVGLFFLTLIVAAVGTLFAWQQRLWPFDEQASYEAAVTVAKTGVRGLMANYQNWGWLATQHPPFAPIVYGQFMHLFGDSLLAARIPSLLFSLGTGGLTYFIGRELYDRRTGFWAACFLFTFPLVMRLSATAMVEPMLVFFFTLTLFFTLMWVRYQSWPYLIAVGVVAGLGMLTKYTMVFVGPIVLGFIFLKGSRRQVLQIAGMLLLALLLFGLLWVSLASRIHVLQIQFETITHYAGLVLTNEYGRNLLIETLSNRLPSALGVYNLPLIVLGTAVLLGRRRRADWLVLLWITAVWLPLCLTLPDHRYFLSSFPALAILIAVNGQLIPKPIGRSLLYAVLCCLGALYLFVDWSRAAHLFIP